MKKSIIGSLAGGVILFLWQFLSWTVLDLHRAAQEYTPKQDTLLAVLGASLEKEGGYYLPGAPKGTSFEEMEKLAAENIGKPWVSIQYHSKMEYNMGINMARAFAVDVLLVWMLIWLLGKFAKNDFTTTLFSSLIVGIIVYLNSAYTSHVWYKIFDIRAFLIDAIVMWGLTGIWLGWWLNRKES
jgi:hypothetical protein